MSDRILPADVARCRFRECPSSHRCLRFTSPDSENKYNQSYILPWLNPGEIRCESFISNVKEESK